MPVADISGRFIDVYAAVSDLITGQEDLAALIDGVARDLAAQNVRYAEVQVYPGALVGNGIPRGR